MIIVIIAGGSGTRLWPLSTPSRPKHLLKLTGERSLVQNTYDRAKRLGDVIYIITEQGHAHLIQEQLPELPKEAFIIEPARRNTASCVIAALEYIRNRHDHNEPIAFLAADHVVRDTDGFVSSFERAGRISQENGRQVLVGIEPSYPSTGFGYIEKGESISGDPMAFNVTSFKEKPDLQTAQTFFSSGHYVWNAGYFVASLDVFLRVMKDFAPELFKQYEDLCAAKNKEDYDRIYLGFINKQIDIALNEKVKDLAVVTASFDWVDLGSFKDLHEANISDYAGNHVTGGNIYAPGVENAYIRNEEDKPIAVIGLDNVVVINTPDGILVSRKDLSQKVGEIAKQIQAGK